MRNLISDLKAMQQTYNLNIEETAESLKNFGIAVEISPKKYKSFLEVLENVQDKWNSEKDMIIKTALVQSVVGIRYMNTLIAILDLQ